MPELAAPPRRAAGAPFRLTARMLVRGVVAALAVAAVVLALTTSGFTSIDNVKAIATSAALVGILGCGMTYIVLSGNLFSLSLGTTAAVCALVFVALLGQGLPVAIGGAMLSGALICALQGYVVGAWGANPIVVTIGAGALLQGIAIWRTGGQSVLPGPDAAAFDVLVEPIAGIPFVVYVFALTVLVAELALRTTRFGREVYLLGDNRRAAHAAGLRVTGIVTGVFAVAGLAAGLCGVLLGAQSGRGELLLEGTLTFDALAAVLVGGNAIGGGRGSAWRTALGAVAIATVTDMLLLRGYDTGVQLLVKGVAVTLVVVLVHLNRSDR